MTSRSRHSSGARVSVIDERARLAALETEWASLLTRSASDEISLHPIWVLAWWDVFGSEGDRALRTLAVREDGVLVGLALLQARSHEYRPRLTFRRLETLASGEDEADEICSPHLGVIAARGREALVAAAVADALAEGALGPWDEVVLPAMREGAALASLRTELGRVRARVSIDDGIRAPFITLPSTFAAYIESLDGPRRTQLSRWMESLEDWAGGAPVLERVRSEAELAAGRAVLESLHREREPDGGPFRSARFRAFHDRVTPALLSLGALDVGWLAVRGRPVAAFYNLRWAGKVWHYQSAHAAAAPERVRIGVTLQALLVRDAIAEGMREYDFLAGVQDYKMSLALTTRPVVTVRAARRSAVELARRIVARARRLAPRFVVHKRP